MPRALGQSLLDLPHHGQCFPLVAAFGHNQPARLCCFASAISCVGILAYLPERLGASRAYCGACIPHSQDDIGQGKMVPQSLGPGERLLTGVITALYCEKTQDTSRQHAILPARWPPGSAG